MGFEPEDVGRALVATRGDATAALAMLRGAPMPAAASGAPAAANAPELSQEEEDRLLAEAIQMSLVQTPRAKAHSAHRPPGTSSDAGNPLWAPPRYLPKDANALEHGPRTLSLVEHISVRDGGYEWQPATAFLDTCNQLMTLV